MKTFILFSVSFLLIQFNSCGQPNPVNKSEFLTMGGIEQWVTIKGDDDSKPVLLFLHGGPGSPFTPYAEGIFKGWEKDFVLVHWDQRGTGKTFGTYAPEELDPDFLKSHPLSVDQMVQDGIELTEYLLEQLGKEKIILFGTSWGSVLGAKMASARPELFNAYIGHSQLVNPSENNIYTYNKLLQVVKDKEDPESLKILENIGQPPYDQARNLGQLIRVIKKYERMQSDPFPEEWAVLSSEYNNAKDAQNREDGDDYSFLSYAGDKRFAVDPLYISINLLQDNFRFEIPVYLLQGEEDILTPLEITSEYYEKLEAPKKDLIFVPNAAHGFTSTVVETLYRVLKENIVPNIKE